MQDSINTVRIAVRMPPVTTCLPSDLALAEGAGADVPRVGVLGTEDEVVVDEILEVLAELRRAVTFETITGPRLAGIAVAGSCVGAPGAEAVAENWVASDCMIIESKV